MLNVSFLSQMSWCCFSMFSVRETCSTTCIHHGMRQHFGKEKKMKRKANIHIGIWQIPTWQFIIASVAAFITLGWTYSGCTYLYSFISRPMALHVCLPAARNLYWHSVYGVKVGFVIIYLSVCHISGRQAGCWSSWISRPAAKLLIVPRCQR